jgi:SAM-dependent methyltransferase
MPWFYAVAERDHEIQNPTSGEKIRRLGEYLRLKPDTRVLDMGAGRGGPALLFAQEFGCRIVAVEQAPEFAAVARERVAAAAVHAQIEVIETDARAFPVDPGAYDVAVCLGASFIWSGLEGTLAALVPAVRAGGHIAVGEPYWRDSPVPVDDLGYTTLGGTTRRFGAAGLSVVGVIASSEDDWDTYESLHWRSLEEWLDANPDDPDAAGIRARHDEARAAYLDHRRRQLGWAIVVGWKRPGLQSSVRAG